MVVGIAPAMASPPTIRRNWARLTVPSRTARSNLDVTVSSWGCVVFVDRRHRPDQLW
jgi:hypothetical protein